MGSVNVNRSLSDQFYRYKMPKIIAKVEGKGNGIKTVIVNMVEIAKALNRPPTYPTKYFGCELGAQTQFDVKNERYIVNGSHEAAKLQDILDGFIRRFVLCPSCDNPETTLGVLQKKGLIMVKCIACGYSGTLDSAHKLITFILKNPPHQSPGATGSSVQSGKKSKRKSKEDSSGKHQENGEDGDSPQHDSDPDVCENTAVNGDDVDWSVDTDDFAVAKRMEDLTAGAKGLMLNNDLEKTQQERVNIFYEFVKFTHENHKAQKYLLGGLEQVVKLHKDSLMNKIPHILKTFYDTDILEEEVLIDWDKKVSKKYVSKEIAQEIHEKAKPFIKWLQEAEEEESSSEEEEAVEVVYSDRHISTKIQEVKEEPKPVSTTAGVENSEDDIDIDDI
ncbi:eukaryotic translation initiation factor 5 isoform X3 [Tachypleus tridentatus]|uniref:eukaryotic translation initiation factor 5 isoform X3 n=1 Tax=Tachypleus tridentatus TaxID=6853 RepID=UPI003FD5944F